MLHWVAIQFNG